MVDCTKIKVFKFRVCNFTSNSLREDFPNRNYFDERQAELVSEETIESTVNDFIKDKDVVSITVNNIDVDYHNNGRANTIDLLYTILYREAK